MSLEPITEVGGQAEANELFITGSVVPLMIDTTVVAYTDQKSPGHLAVADVALKAGWVVRHAQGAQGPGELNGEVPMLSSAGDTVKTLTPGGRLAARLPDGALLYDSAIARTMQPGVVAFTMGLASNRRVSEYHVEGDAIEIGVLIESASGHETRIPLGTVEREADGSFRSPLVVRARGDLVVVLRGRTIATMDEGGREIASVEVPWETANAYIDGTSRVWVQVFGGVSSGYNLILFTRDLQWVGRAIVPRFRDSFGDFVLSIRVDSLDVETMVLSTLTR